MYQQNKEPEIKPAPHNPEIKPVAPERPGQAPHPGIMPQHDPAPAPRPAEVPPGKGN